jgi:hypothetical protein
VEGRSRESIFRDGRWWDEIAMSVLESDWRRMRLDDAEDEGERALLHAEALGSQGREAEGARSDDDGRAAGSTTTRLLRRTMRKLR